MALREGNQFFRPTVAENTSQFVEERYPFDQMIVFEEQDKQKEDFMQGKLDQMS